MKVFTITENNFNYIYGRLKKFFRNNNETGFECWHDFDCGFKKHICRQIIIDGKKVKTNIIYPQPLSISANCRETVTGKFIIESIHIRFTATRSNSISIGDKIAFMGNRIIIRQKWFIKDKKYIYTVCQVKPMDYYDQRIIHERAEREDQVYRDLTSKFKNG